jgi:hypothetical protein
VRGRLGVVEEFAAISDRQLFIQLIPAARDHRYDKAACTTTQLGLDFGGFIF